MLGLAEIKSPFLGVNLRQHLCFDCLDEYIQDGVHTFWWGPGAFDFEGIDDFIICGDIIKIPFNSKSSEEIIEIHPNV